MAAALTLLPALLSLLGDRVNALRIPFFGRAAEREESPFWSRVVRGVMRRPVISLVLATAALLVMAAPVLALRSGEAGVSTLRTGLPHPRALPPDRRQPRRDRPRHRWP